MGDGLGCTRSFPIQKSEGVRDGCVGFPAGSLSPNAFDPLLAGGLEVSLILERRIGFGRQADFLVLAASWFAFGSLFQTEHIPPSIFIAWVLLTTALLVISLDAIGYFDRYTPQPELSGVLSLFLALPFSAFLARWVVARVTETPL